MDCFKVWVRQQSHFHKTLKHNGVTNHDFEMSAVYCSSDLLC